MGNDIQRVQQLGDSIRQLREDMDALSKIAPQVEKMILCQVLQSLQPKILMKICLKQIRQLQMLMRRQKKQRKSWIKYLEEIKQHEKQVNVNIYPKYF